MSKDYILNNHRRFALIPFLAKSNGKYVHTYIFANIYETGIISLQFIIPFEYENISQSDNKSSIIKFEDVCYHLQKSEYRIKDFYEFQNMGKQEFDDVVRYYIEMLRKMCSNISITDHDFDRKTWMFCDFNENKYSKHKEFIDKNKDMYLIHSH